jgi:beta-xylosidase
MPCAVSGYTVIKQFDGSRKLKPFIYEDYQPGSWKTSRTFYCSTSDINSYGSWSEPIFVNQKGIDPSLLFHDGKVYITSQGVNNDNDVFWGIYQSEIDIETGRHLTERKQLWKGHTYKGTHYERPEGPHLYHIGDWYYLLIAEGKCFRNTHLLLGMGYITISFRRN